jgi:hypothetical protein
MTMFNPFAYLRRKAAEAVVGGVSDGLRAVAPEGEDPPPDLDSLRAMLAQAAQPRALAAAPDEPEDAEAVPAKGGRRK